MAKIIRRQTYLQQLIQRSTIPSARWLSLVKILPLIWTRIDKTTHVMRYIYTIFLLICVLTVKAQGDVSYPISYLSSSMPMSLEVGSANMGVGYKQTVYWKRHKKFKAYAYGTLGLGICSMTVGWLGKAGNSAITNSNWKEEGKVWDVVLVAGTGLMISSIPLFILSHKNKVKAKEGLTVSLVTDNINLDLQNGTKHSRQTIGVNVSF